MKLTDQQVREDITIGERPKDTYKENTQIKTNKTIQVIHIKVSLFLCEWVIQFKLNIYGKYGCVMWSICFQNSVRIQQNMPITKTTVANMSSFFGDSQGPSESWGHSGSSFRIGSPEEEGINEKF